MKLTAEYNETTSNKLKSAVLHSMLPKEFQAKLLDKSSVNFNTVEKEEAEKILTVSKEELKNSEEQEGNEPTGADGVRCSGRQGRRKLELPKRRRGA